ncbi:hypothetical protein CPCC7001_1909 [Cyanobium sp. PCC 7001]|nr:hypothetical protein CPCC7001_1909 [Cyanobium sp. PCC 7001]
MAPTVPPLPVFGRRYLGSACPWAWQPSLPSDDAVGAS